MTITMMMIMTMMMIFTSSFSELKIESLPGVVHIGVLNMIMATLVMMIRMRMMMTMTMMMMTMISTSSFSELKIKSLPGVVHIRVSEGDVVHGVVANRTNHL